ncbi:trypsin alpha-4-like [Anopheles aquasalis]|uniref:trypsin alpha-4-like n=1 Tax=Anopheles aquasalis TaxID=42839 RepID=UPI00215B46A3|nr:trypsin alpha-4-like [Anopheles aquasalis]
MVGAIISDNQVLSSASGLEGTLGIVMVCEECLSMVTVRVGSTWTNSGGFLFDIRMYATHKDYDRNTLANDVILITVAGNFTGLPNVQPITMSTTESPMSSSCLVLGYGKDENGNYGALRRTDYQPIGNQACESELNQTLPVSLV